MASIETPEPPVAPAPPTLPDLAALHDPARRDAILAEPGTARVLALNHPGWWFALYGMIVDKRNRLRPVVGIEPISGQPYEGVNWLQWQFFDAAAYFYHHDLPFRGIGLKPRKTGLSTAVQAYLYWRHRLAGCMSLTFADKDRTSAVIQRIFRTFYREDRMDWGSTVKEAEGAFRFSNDSVAERETARSANLARGSTPLMQHRSEVAHFLEGDTIDAGLALVGANAATAMVEGSFIMDESTPNGWGNYFAKEYWGDVEGDSPELRLPAVTFAQWKAGNKGNGHVKFFAPWFKFRDNVDHFATAADLERVRDTLNEKERALVKEHKLVLRQISWRRAKVAECRSEALFVQEHTEDERLAFILAGRPFFDVEAIDKLFTFARAHEPEVGRLVRQPNGKVQFYPDPQGRYHIWEKPTRGYPYLFTADTMTGASQVDDVRKADTHACFMGRGYVRLETTLGTRTLPPAIVARVAPPFQDDTAPALEVVGLLIDYYSPKVQKCLSAVEVNNSGLSWVDRMPQLGYPVCHHEIDPIDMGKKPSRRRGWLTSSKTRRPMLDALADMIREGNLDLRCPTALGMFQTFVFKANGKIEAASGTLDDDVLACAIFAYSVQLCEVTF